jgi:aerobic-type carbon monoxide dehydrogenase small subunit (CoxS/CutS family)
MARFTLRVNGEERKVEAAPETPLLWIVRDSLGLTGTKYGCGLGLCGACTVLLDGEAVRSCQTPVKDAAGHGLVTIEGLSAGRGQAVQSAWAAEDVPQCGYCQSGQILAATALLARKPHPTDADIDAAMSGILCRCGTYNRIRRAIRRAAKGARP